MTLSRVKVYKTHPSAKLPERAHATDAGMDFFYCPGGDEIFVNLHNVGKEPQTIIPGQKVAQGVFVRIEKPFLWESEEDNLYDENTSRGSGALGSTGDF